MNTQESRHSAVQRELCMARRVRDGQVSAAVCVQAEMCTTSAMLQIMPHSNRN